MSSCFFIYHTSLIPVHEWIGLSIWVCCLVFRSAMASEARLDPEVAAEVAVIGTWRVLEACRKWPTQYQRISAASWSGKVSLSLNVIYYCWFISRYSLGNEVRFWLVEMYVSCHRVDTTLVSVPSVGSFWALHWGRTSSGWMVWTPLLGSSLNDIHTFLFEFVLLSLINITEKNIVRY